MDPHGLIIRAARVEVDPLIQAPARVSYSGTHRQGRTRRRR